MFIDKRPYPSLNDKMAFFAQYYNQQILRSMLPEQSGYLSKVDPGKFPIPHLILNSKLELKDIANIALEDLKIIEDMQYVNILEVFEGKLQLLPANVMDYLRSKGYALPYLDYTLEEMVEYFWIKIV